MRTGILGGTFDPIHIAHLHAAEAALHQFDLDRVLVMPAGDPWQKADRQVSLGSDRLEMCRLATDGVEGLVVDDRELVRTGPTYTVETLATFPSDEELFLIVGSDSAARIHTWERSEEVLARVNLLVAPRPGDHQYDPAHGETLDMGRLDISATDIRERVRCGKPFRYLVTQAVHDYIVSKGLYTKGE